MEYQKKKNKTKIKIKKAILELMENKKFESITINDITDKSEVNRSTFYRYFLDKYDLIDQIENDIIKELDSIHKNIYEYIKNNNVELKTLMIFDLEEYNKRLFTIFSENRYKVHILLGEHNTNSFYNKCFTLIETATKLMINLYNRNPSFNLNLLTSYTTSSMISILKFWANNETVDINEIEQFMKKVNRQVILLLLSNEE